MCYIVMYAQYSITVKNDLLSKIRYITPLPYPLSESITPVDPAEVASLSYHYSNLLPYNIIENSKQWWLEPLSPAVEDGFAASSYLNPFPYLPREAVFV